MARVCVDSDDFYVDGNGVLHLNENTDRGRQRLLTYSTVGTANFNKASYPGLKSVRVVCIGGGGGGAGANAAANQCTVRAGGSGGGASESVFRAEQLPVGNIAMVIGAAGLGGVGNSPGGNGGNTSFGGSLVMARGGIGSETTQTSGTAMGCVSGTPGPLAGEGQIRMGGGAGGGAIRLDGNTGLSGAGGDTGGGWGTGGFQRASEGNPGGERGFGSGGAGAISKGGNESGGDGARGAIFLYLSF